LKKFAEVAGISLSNTRVVYGGDDSYRGENQKFISWKEIELPQREQALRRGGLSLTQIA
jgi:hypothetical protein